MGATMADAIYGSSRVALKFKGDEDVKKKKKKKEKKAKKEEDDEEDDGPAPVMDGSGRIVCSKMTIQGFETKFKEECAVGDTIIVQHPNSLVEESRIVVGIMSQRTLTLNESFSTEWSTQLVYEIRKDSISLQKAAEREERKRKREEGDEEVTIDSALENQLAKRLSKQPKTYQERVKTGMWGYKIVTKTFNKEPSKEELLNLRIKSTHDHWAM